MEFYNDVTGRLELQSYREKVYPHVRDPEIDDMKNMLRDHGGVLVSCSCDFSDHRRSAKTFYNQEWDSIEAVNQRKALESLTKKSVELVGHQPTDDHNLFALSDGRVAIGWLGPDVGTDHVQGVWKFNLYASLGDFTRYCCRAQQHNKPGQEPILLEQLFEMDRVFENNSPSSSVRKYSSVF